MKKINLGDISTRRDWGHSKDYARGIWMILQHKEPGDFVLSLKIIQLRILLKKYLKF